MHSRLSYPQGVVPSKDIWHFPLRFVTLNRSLCEESKMFHLSRLVRKGLLQINQTDIFTGSFLTPSPTAAVYAGLSHPRLGEACSIVQRLMMIVMMPCPSLIRNSTPLIKGSGAGSHSRTVPPQSGTAGEGRPDDTVAHACWPSHKAKACDTHPPPPPHCAPRGCHRHDQSCYTPTKQKTKKHGKQSLLLLRSTQSLRSTDFS